MGRGARLQSWRSIASHRKSVTHLITSGGCVSSVASADASTDAVAFVSTRVAAVSSPHPTLGSHIASPRAAPAPAAAEEAPPLSRAASASFFSSV